jgi:hypothetical protein
MKLEPIFKKEKKPDTVIVHLRILQRDYNHLKKTSLEKGITIIQLVKSHIHEFCQKERGLK